jgi:serine/threonine protein kinase
VKDTIDKIVGGKLNFDVTEFQNISKEGIDIIKGLLNIDPNERFNPYEVLNHPWMKISDLNIVKKKFYNKAGIFFDSLEENFKKMTFISMNDKRVNRIFRDHVENSDSNYDNDYLYNKNVAELLDNKKEDFYEETSSSYNILNIQHRKRSGSI